MKLGTIVTNENHDHEYRGDFHSDESSIVETAPAEAVDAESELESNVSEIDNISTGIIEAEGAIERISEIQGQVQENIDAGHSSLSPVEEVSIQASMESIMTSLGLPYSRATLESVAYGQRAAHCVATLESENRSMMERIANGFKILVDQIITFIQNLFRNSWALLKYADYVQKRVDKIRGVQPSKQEMTSSSAKALSVNGKADQSSISSLAKTAANLMGASTIAAEEVEKLNFEFSGDSGKDQHYAKIISHVTLDKAGNGLYGHLTGGRSFNIKESVDAGLEITAVNNGAIATVIPVASEKEMRSLLDNARSIIKSIKDFDSKRSVLKNAASRISQYVAQDLTNSAGLVSKSARNRSRSLGYIRFKRGLLNKVIGRYPLEAFKIAKAFIDYARHSLAHYNVE